MTLIQQTFFSEQITNVNTSKAHWHILVGSYDGFLCGGNNYQAVYIFFRNKDMQIWNFYRTRTRDAA